MIVAFPDSRLFRQISGLGQLLLVTTFLQVIEAELL